jgi:hypothetical protein
MVKHDREFKVFRFIVIYMMACRKQLDSELVDLLVAV